MIPVGYIRYEVQRLDTLSSIAFEHGTTWEEIYEDMENVDFRRRRPNPNHIVEGDILYIRQKEEPEQFQLGIWTGEIASFQRESPIVGIRLSLSETRYCRYDSSKGIFLDEPLNGKDSPPAHHMDKFKEKIQRLRKTEEQLRMERLEAENKALKEELARLKSPRPYVSTTEEECRGGCSRGGDGPCCGKRGCRG